MKTEKSILSFFKFWSVSLDNNLIRPPDFLKSAIITFRDNDWKNTMHFTSNAEFLQIIEEILNVFSLQASKHTIIHQHHVLTKNIKIYYIITPSNYVLLHSPLSSEGIQ